MNTKSVTFTYLILFICMLSIKGIQAQDLQVRELVDSVFVITDNKSGDGQVVIVSAKGLVVLSSFSSPSTAAKFRKAIAEHLKRDDFCYLIDMVDRVDEFWGNAAYKDIPIIAHRALWDKYRGNKETARGEIRGLTDMWREKENDSRERLKNAKPGSESAIRDQQWLESCKQRADELESEFSLVLPTEIYQDRMALDLGDITLNLIWFGKTEYAGPTAIIIPERKLAILRGLHPQHLAPCPGPGFIRCDVPRWISVLEEMLEGEKAVDHVLCGTYCTDLWSRDRAHTHLHYIRELWNKVSKAEADGMALDEIQKLYSFDDSFAYIKNMQCYIDYGDGWIRPQHSMHIRQFFLQHKNLASELIVNAGIDSLDAVFAHIRKLIDEGDDIYIDEISLTGAGFDLMNKGKIPEAVAAFKFNVETYPQSPNVYEFYAGALKTNGDIENAIKNYKKSLELNPDNGHARKMIEDLEKQQH